MWDLIKSAFKHSKVRAIDYYFAEFINKVKQDEAVATAALLTSFNNAKGDVCLDLKTSANKLFFKDENFEGLQTPTLDNWVTAIKAHPWVAEKMFPSPLVLDGYKLYLGKYWNFEQRLAKNILSRLAKQPNFDKDRLEKGLKYYFKENDLDIDWQAIAAKTAVQKGFSVISGGPGTGKTTTVLNVLALLLEQTPNLKIILAAPTGKAAARMTESIRAGKSRLPDEIQNQIPDEGLTIHRLLKVDRDGSAFKHNKKNPIVADAVIIDEASMVDLPLMSYLMDAIPLDAKVILLGDIDQLSSVEAGSVLADITGNQSAKKQGVDATAPVLELAKNSPSISQSVVILQHSYRFDSQSGIGQLATLVNAGKGRQALLNVLQGDAFPDSNWLNLIKDAPQSQIVEYAVGQYQNYLIKTKIAEALSAFECFRVLCAVHSGYCGVEQLNEQIKQKLLSKGLIENTETYAGMPIMIVKNDYDTELFNGDTGVLWKNEAGELAAFFPEQKMVREVGLSRLPEYVPAYALTVHKSQGSEFENVLLCLPDYSVSALTKELIYTGLTRAKKHLTLVADEDVFIQACNNKKVRASGLAELLGW